MKKFWFVLISFLLAFGWAAAADTSEAGVVSRPLSETAQADGYFKNTRSVLLLEPIGEEAAPYIASLIRRETDRIFRYPYYRQIDEGEAAEGLSLSEMGRKYKADIVVLPVIVEFSQFRHYGGFFRDGDPIVTTAACLRLYYWETGMARDAAIETRFFDRKEEGPDTDPDRIFDAMWGKLLKKFPYRRIPIDRGKNLTGNISVSEDGHEM